MPRLKEFVNEYLEVLNGKPKTDDLLEKYILDPELKEQARFFEYAFPEYELLIDDMIEEENKIAIYGKLRGVHKGELMGIPATGKKISISLMLIYEIENRKIINHWMVADKFTLMQQLGVIK